MAKSLRSKIKRKFRTELRKKIGVPHQAIQEAKIQENLKKAIESQGASLVLRCVALHACVPACMCGDRTVAVALTLLLLRVCLNAQRATRCSSSRSSWARRLRQSL